MGQKGNQLKLQLVGVQAQDTEDQLRDEADDLLNAAFYDEKYLHD